MEALFIGQAYIDITFLTDTLPSGDEKALAHDYAVSFGGNAVTAGFTCAKLGISPDIMCSQANDWLAHMFLDMAARYGISIHGRKVKESSLSFIMPKDGKRAIVRCRDDNYLHPFQQLRLDGCRALHLDGHMPDAALHYARACREAGILTSLDGGAVRENTDELLHFIDVAIVSARFCEQLGLDIGETLDYLRGHGCRVGGVTLGDDGMHWFEDQGANVHHPALNVPRLEDRGHERRRRCFPRGLHLFLPLGATGPLERSLSLRARGIGPRNPAPGKRSKLADAGKRGDGNDAMAGKTGSRHNLTRIRTPKV